MRGVFVTGTDTGVGKTVFCAGLAWALKRRSIDVGIMKPFATASKVFSKKYRSADVALLARAAGVKENDADLNPSFYSIAASPMMASSLTGKPPPAIQDVLESLQRLAFKHDFLIVEGIGGIMVPLTMSNPLADFVKLAELPVIIIARPGLGTLNHTVLTVNACKNYGLRIAGIVVNSMPKKPTLVEKNNPDALSKLTNVPVIGIIPKLRVPAYSSAGRAIEKAIDLDLLISMK
ncbi:MAG: dethiobiotin synthase [Nitrososphaera sp.]